MNSIETQNKIGRMRMDDCYHAMYSLLTGLKKSHGGIDLDLLHKQKLTLIDIAAEERDAVNGSDRQEEKDAHIARADSLDGLVEFLDTFQDMLADDLKIWEYPEPKEDER